MKNCRLLLMIACIWLPVVSAESGISSGAARPSSAIKEGKISGSRPSLEKNGKLSYKLIGRLKREGGIKAGIKNISFSPSGTNMLVEYPDYCLLVTPSLFLRSLTTKKIPHLNCRWEKREIIASEKKGSDNVSFFPVRSVTNLYDGQKPSSKMLFFNEKGKK